MTEPDIPEKEVDIRTVTVIESVREATPFTHDGEAVTEPDVLETEVDIRTVAVTEPVRETTRFPHDGGTVTGQDVLETEVDIRTVTVMSADDEGSLGEAALEIEQMWPTVEAMVHTASCRYKKMDNTLRPEQ